VELLVSLVDQVLMEELDFLDQLGSPAQLDPLVAPVAQDLLAPPDYLVRLEIPEILVAPVRRDVLVQLGIQGFKGWLETLEFKDSLVIQETQAA